MSSYISAGPQNDGHDWTMDLVERLLWLEMDDESKVIARLRAIEADAERYNARWRS
jgi:hypothetical protein